MSGKDNQSTRALEAAAAEVERSKRQLASTMGALQYRLKPGTLANHAWQGMREKSGEMADNTLQAVKNRPAAVSGVLAAIVIYIAREPLWNLAAGFFADSKEAQPGTIQARLDHDEDYDLTAPTVARSRPEGVNA